MRPTPILTLILVGCSSATLPVDTWRDDLAAARQRWQAAGHSDYSFSYQRQCFCPPLHLRVTVTDNNVTSIFDITGDTLFTSSPDDYTVPGLFDDIDNILDNRPDRFTAEYQANTGMPLSISADPIIEAVDDELGFTVSEIDVR